MLGGHLCRLIETVLQIIDRFSVRSTTRRQNHLDGLVTFITVAEEKGFSNAAVKLGVSPSAISESIRGT
ncbi:helix-turn-helix domain-containing protein [Pseudomonas frederiksbergensis]|uniref:helix-turn-helix domain-containing protein n=1 Tax=Pseudomonas frederiksbergensis TaxID=104087 RepID=UPI003D1D1972